MRFCKKFTFLSFIRKNLTIIVNVSIARNNCSPKSWLICVQNGLSRKIIIATLNLNSDMQQMAFVPDQWRFHLNYTQTLWYVLNTALCCEEQKHTKFCMERIRIPHTLCLTLLFYTQTKFIKFITSGSLYVRLFVQMENK